jgi:predicted nucleic acid-binding protein
MVKKTEAYVDTSALIAFLDRSDSHHTVFRRLFSSPPKLTTSSLVVAEGHGWFLRRYDAHRALQFLSFIEALPGLRIRSFDKAEVNRVSAVVKKYADQKLTLADAHGIWSMQDLRIEWCWSTDRHLGLGGAKLVGGL